LSSQAQAQTVEAYSRLPSISHPELSPNGNWMATRCPTEQGGALCVNDLRTGDLRFTLPVPRDAWIESASFVSDQHLVISMGFMETITTDQGLEYISFSRAMSVNVETGENTALMRRQRWSSDTTNIVSPNLQDPDSILVQMTFLFRPDIQTGSNRRSREQFSSELYRVDLNSGNARRIKRDEAIGRVVTPQGEIIALVTHDPEDYEFAIHRGDRRGDVIYEGVHQSDAPAVIGRMDATGLLIFSYDSSNYGHRRMDMTTGEITPLPDLDLDVISSGIFDLDGNLVGFNGEKAGVADQAFLDEELIADVRALEGALSRNLLIYDFTLDRNMMILGTSEPGRPQDFYLYEKAAGALSLINNSYPGLAEQPLPSREIIAYAASDGMVIPAVLTRPVGWTADQGPLPLVMLPHGGPASRDSLSFDWWAQAYAQQGYLVLQPNFRGSVGFGVDHKEAGYGEFGHRMIEDILDGARTLQDQGLAQPGPYCVAGGSYGGYAALRAAIMAPEDVGCVVAFAPVTDPAADMGLERRYGSFRAYDFWRQYMGDIAFDADAAAEISITENTERLTMPVLVLHGVDDDIVSVEASRALRRRMREAENFDYVELEDETHFLIHAESRHMLLQRSLALFDQTLRP